MIMHVVNGGHYSLHIVFFAVASVFTRPPVVVAEERAIEVNFDSSLLDDSADRVMFSSNCTGSTAEAYSPTVRISIPDALPGVNSGQCRYTIQLVDTSSQPIGYSITGFFNITGQCQQLSASSYYFD